MIASATGEPSSGTSARLYMGDLLRGPTRRRRGASSGRARRRGARESARWCRAAPTRPRCREPAVRDRCGHGCDITIRSAFRVARGLDDRGGGRAVPHVVSTRLTPAVRRRRTTAARYSSASRTAVTWASIGSVPGKRVSLGRAEQQSAALLFPARSSAPARAPSSASIEPSSGTRILSSFMCPSPLAPRDLPVVEATAVPGTDIRANRDVGADTVRSRPWDGAPRWDTAPRRPRGAGRARRRESWYLLIRRWKVFRSIPAALAAAEMLPSWRSSSSRRYEAFEHLHPLLLGVLERQVAARRQRRPRSAPGDAAERRAPRAADSPAGRAGGRARPSASAHARSMTFCSSRTLPGQA